MKKSVLFGLIGLFILLVIGVAYLNSDQYKIKNLKSEYLVLLNENELIDSLNTVESIYTIDKSDIEIDEMVLNIFQFQKLNAVESDTIKQLINDYIESKLKNDEQLERNLALTSDHSFESKLSEYYLYSKSFQAITDDYIANEDYQLWLKSIAQNIEVKNIDFQEDLALMYEQLEDYDLSFELAQEFEEQAEDRELARMLGLSYLYLAQDYSKAYFHLDKYLATNMEKYKSISLEYDQIIQRIWDKFGDRFEAGLLSQEFYDNYEKADDAGKDALYNDAYIEVRNKTGEFLIIDKKYEDVYFLLRVILDYGQSTLLYAMSIENPKQSQYLLEKAEEIYLSISNDASDREDYQLFLGQVKFWLGKKKEGKKLFDSYLEQNDRSVYALSNIAEKYREIGSTKLSKELYEEAYEKSEDQQDKYYIAESLALFADTTEAKLKWVELSDLSFPRNLAEKTSLEGSLLEQQGELELAQDKYLASIELYNTLNSTSTVLNNVSIIYAKLYYLTRDIKYLNLESETITQATELSPTNSILLSNAAHTNATYSDYVLQSDYFDFDLMGEYPEFSYYPYLYSSFKEKKVLINKMKTNKNVNDLLKFKRTLLTLAPNDKEHYYTLISYYNFYRDLAGIEMVARQAKNSGFSYEKLENNDDYTDEEFKQNYNDANQYFMNIKKSAQKAGTLKYIELAELKWQVVELTRKETLDKKAANNILNKYQKIIETNPSSKAFSEYDGAIMSFLNKDVIDQSLEYKKFDEKYNQLSNYNNLIVASILDLNVKKAIQNSEFSQMLINSFAQQDVSFPESNSIYEYHMYRILGIDNSDLDYEFNIQLFKAYGYLSNYKLTSKSDLFFAESIGKSEGDMKQELLNIRYSMN